MKKPTIIFSIITFLRLFFVFLPTFLVNKVDARKFHLLNDFFYTPAGQIVEQTMAGLFYASFLICLTYSVVKKMTGSYVLIWLTLLLYFGLSYWLGNSSLIFNG